MPSSRCPYDSFGFQLHNFKQCHNACHMEILTFINCILEYFYVTMFLFLLMQYVHSIMVLVAGEFDNKRILKSNQNTLYSKFCLAFFLKHATSWFTTIYMYNGHQPLF